jgi:hypothetical protein
MGKARKPWSKKNHIKVAMADWSDLERRFGCRVAEINAAVRSYTRKTRTFTIHRLALPEDLAVELDAWQVFRKGTERNGAPPAVRAVD